MNATDTQARATVDCPLCGARAGEPCVNTVTRYPFVGFTHVERRKAAAT